MNSMNSMKPRHSSIELLAQTAMVEGRVIERMSIQGCPLDIATSLIFFDETSREIEMVFYWSPDEFVAEVDFMLDKGLRPIAVEVCEDDSDGEENYQCLEMFYVEAEPSIEDEAIIDAMFVTVSGVLV